MDSTAAGGGIPGKQKLCRGTKEMAGGVKRKWWRVGKVVQEGQERQEGHEGKKEQEMNQNQNLQRKDAASGGRVGLGKTSLRLLYVWGKNQLGNERMGISSPSMIMDSTTAGAPPQAASNYRGGGRRAPP